MVRLSISFAALLVALPSVLGHGQVFKVTTSSGTYTAADAYHAADPASPLRKLNEYGPAAPFDGPNITCGPGGNIPISKVVDVKAGSQVVFDWGNWGSSHSGPVMTYVARCPNGCANFKGDSGAVWYKIQQDGFVKSRTPLWGEEIIRSTGKYTVTVPSKLANGEYILRHEILGLHVAGQRYGAQFYPNCLQIKITDGGSTTPGTSGIALPGAYKPDDPAILTQLWWYNTGNATATYTPPGGPVLIAP